MDSTHPYASGAGTVEPRLAVTRNGAVVLCGGRPGLFLWLNADGTGKDWQKISIFDHHNSLASAEERFGGYRSDGTTAYGTVIVLDGNEVLFIYDCFSLDRFGIYVMKATIDKTP